MKNLLLLAVIGLAFLASCGFNSSKTSSEEVIKKIEETVVDTAKIEAQIKLLKESISELKKENNIEMKTLLERMNKANKVSWDQIRKEDFTSLKEALKDVNS